MKFRLVIEIDDETRDGLGALRVFGEGQLHGDAQVEAMKALSKELGGRVAEWLEKEHGVLVGPPKFVDSQHTVN